MRATNRQTKHRDRVNEQENEFSVVFLLSPIIIYCNLYLKSDSNWG